MSAFLASSQPHGIEPAYDIPPNFPELLTQAHNIPGPDRFSLLPPSSIRKKRMHPTGNLVFNPHMPLPGTPGCHSQYLLELYIE